MIVVHSCLNCLAPLLIFCSRFAAGAKIGHLRYLPKKDLLQNAPKKAPSMLQSTQLHRAPPSPPPTRSFPALHEHEGESVRQRERLVTKLARSHNHPHHIDSNHTLFGTPTKIRRSAHFLAFNLVQQYTMHVAANM